MAISQTTTKCVPCSQCNFIRFWMNKDNGFIRPSNWDQWIAFAFCSSAINIIFLLDTHTIYKIIFFLRDLTSLRFLVNQFHPSLWSSYFIIVSLFHTCTICAIVLILIHKHKYQMKIFLVQMFVPCKKHFVTYFISFCYMGKLHLLSQYKVFDYIVATKCNVLFCNSFELCMMDLCLS